jgi:hypothetical protein
MMSYVDENDITLDLSSAGRGLQQTMLLVAYLLANPRTVLLLDEPDAHLEILRQRETYNLLTQLARDQKSQIIAASHSEVVLNEAASRDVVVAFVGRPHRLDSRGQLEKWLADYPIDHLYQAEETGWVLYLEGSLADMLRRPFVIYVANDVSKAQRHFHALREAKPNIAGVALFDRLGNRPAPGPGLAVTSWRRREIENYFCKRSVLLRWARDQGEGEIFSHSWEEIMAAAIDNVDAAQRTLGRDIWSNDIKASDDVFDPVFRQYFSLRGQPMLFRKADYHQLVRFMKYDELDSEIVEKLDDILKASHAARAI